METWLRGSRSFQFPFFFTAFLVLIVTAFGPNVTGGGSKCQEITIPMCKGISYNNTNMPNQFNHDSQEEAGMEVHQYWPLVEIKCSLDLRLFLCSLYVPICVEEYKGAMPPCRSLCERARFGCEPVMTQYGFQWPERMKCDGFLEFGNNNVCTDNRNGEMPPASPPTDISENTEIAHISGPVDPISPIVNGSASYTKSTNTNFYFVIFTIFGMIELTGYIIN